MQKATHSSKHRSASEQHQISVSRFPALKSFVYGSKVDGSDKVDNDCLCSKPSSVVEILNQPSRSGMCNTHVPSSRSPDHVPQRTPSDDEEEIKGCDRRSSTDTTESFTSINSSHEDIKNSTRPLWPPLLGNTSTLYEPPLFADGRQKDSRPVSIAVGTWNTEYQSFDMDDFIISTANSYSPSMSLLSKSTSTSPHLIPTCTQFLSPQRVMGKPYSDNCATGMYLKPLEMVSAEQYDKCTNIIKGAKILPPKKTFSNISYQQQH